MTRHLLDVAIWQGSLKPADVKRAGFSVVNLKVSHGLSRKSVHPNVAGWVEQAKALGLGISTFHYFTADATGAAQAAYAYERIRELGLLHGTAHQLDVECDPAPKLADVRAYLDAMRKLLERPVVVYTGDWWWKPKGWDVSALAPHAWCAPNAGYLGSYPGDTSPHWKAGYGGWPELAVMQYAVAPLSYPDGSRGTIDVSKSAIRHERIWTELTSRPTVTVAVDRKARTPMPMNPRTHPRGTRPDFTLPRPNPNPSRMTDALWWLVCMREALEPSKSANGGTFADKPGYHNAGSNLPDHGEGNAKTDHSIRRAPDREGSWWKSKSSAHDWTFTDAQAGNYATISLYSKRLINAMKDPNDLRPDDVYAYTLGQVDGDTVVEGYNEYRDEDEASADKTHLWHRHDSFRRNIIGSFAHMWKALTIDMGWTYEEWQRSVAATPAPAAQEDDDMTKAEFTAWMTEWARSEAGMSALYASINRDFVQAYTTDPNTGAQVKREPTDTDNGLMTWASALAFAVRNGDFARVSNLSLHRKIDALSAAVALLVTDMQADANDPDRAAILARIDAAQAAILAELDEPAGS